MSGNGRESSRAKRPRGATSYDVAVRAGVSQSAVSRSFKSGSSIAPTTRARVLAAAEELGYQPNAIAQGLITRRSNLAAVLISNLTSQVFPEILSKLNWSLADKGFRALLFTWRTEVDAAQALEQIWRYRVDGVIADAPLLQEDAFRQFRERGVPLVLYNSRTDSPHIASVSCDHAAGERLLVDRLVGAGHKRFGIISGPVNSSVSQERVSAASTRLAALGLRYEVVEGGFDYDSGQAGFEALMNRTRGRLDAVICANDTMALGAIDRARAQGLAVPAKISIVGFDGVEPGTWSGYALTTVRQPVDRMTEAAVAMMTERIENNDLSAEHRVFGGHLVEGASARLGSPA